MKKSLLFILITQAYAQEALHLAKSDGLKMPYHFEPPPIISPQTDLTTPLENEYRDTPFWGVNPSVAQEVSGVVSRPVQVQLYLSGIGSSQRALFRQRWSQFYAVGQLFHGQLNDFEDANGRKVKAGYKRNGQVLSFGYVPNAHQEYRIGFIRDRIDDDKQARHPQGMDAILTQRQVWNAMIRLGAQDQSQTFNFNVRHVDLKRRADNFKFNPNAPQKVKMVVERQFLDLQGDYRHHWNAQHQSQIGVIYQRDKHHAERFGINPAGMEMKNAFRFPDIHSKRLVIFYDHFYQPNPEFKMSFGINYDWLSANPKDKNTLLMGGYSANGLWQSTYGQSVTHPLKTKGLSAFVAYDWMPSAQQKYTLTFSNIIRHPHNVERFHALSGQNGLGWVGNPFLKPERHRKVALSADIQGNGWKDYGKIQNGETSASWRVNGEIYYDRVDNFISLNRGGMGRNTTTHNTDANIYGLKLNVAKNLTPNLSARLALAYQHAENSQWKRPVYHVRPFTADVGIDWRDYASFGSYHMGLHGRYVAKSKRLDSDFRTGQGLDDPRHYQQYFVANLHAGIQTKNRLAITLGVDNLFNRQYYAFNEFPHTGPHFYQLPNGSVPSHAPAPERTYWLGIHFNF